MIRCFVFRTPPEPAKLKIAVELCLVRYNAILLLVTGFRHLRTEAKFELGDITLRAVPVRAVDAIADPPVGSWVGRTRMRPAVHSFASQSAGI